jgi:type I restriction enzyme S subunit
MHSELIPFTDLLSTIIDNRGRTCPTAPAGIPLIATNCIRNESLYPTREKLRYVSLETHDTWFRGHPLPGDIIIVNKGTPGRVCLVPDVVDFCIAQDMVAVRANPRKIYPKFLFAVLRSAGIQARIEQMHVGSLIPHFKKGDFDKLLLPVPSPALQRFVGDTYFNLAAKIELNRETSGTLEAMARALFKSWFVDFDPVRAKSEGRIPHGMNSETATLFPSNFQDLSVSPPVPKSWLPRAVYDCATYVNGAAYRDFDFSTDRSGLPIIKIAELKAGVTEQTRFTHSNPGEKYKITTGDVLFSWSGNPDTSIDTFVWAGGDAWLNQHIFKVITENKRKRVFVFFMLLHLRPTFAEIARDKQTTGLGHVTVQDLKRLVVPMPSEDVLSAFEKQAGPWFDAIQLNTLQSATLAELRDALLPKLISGEIQVKDAEKNTAR